MASLFQTKAVAISWQETVTKEWKDTLIYTDANGQFQLELEEDVLDSIIDIQAVFEHPYLGVAFQQIKAKATNHIDFRFTTEQDFKEITLDVKRKGKKPESLLVSFTPELGLKKWRPYPISRKLWTVQHKGVFSQDTFFVVNDGFELENWYPFHRMNVFLLKGKYNCFGRK